MNYCCAMGNCPGCWSFWVHHGRSRHPEYPPRREPYPVVNHDRGDEDDSMTVGANTYKAGRPWTKR